MEATLQKAPNKEILEHARKREIEVKCLELEELMLKKGLFNIFFLLLYFFIV